MKFLKTIQFDPSDTFVFENAALPDEWAISGGFLFAGAKEGNLKGKVKQAFSNGFLSAENFGHTTFSSVAEINNEDLENLKTDLAQRFFDELNAPSIEEAKAVSEAEIKFVLDMCDGVAINSIFTVHRFFDELDEIKEEFRIVDAPGEKLHTRIWEVVEE